MTIHRRTAQIRRRVVFVRQPADVAAVNAFSARGLVVESCEPQDLLNATSLATIRAAVFQQTVGKLKRVADELRTHAPLLLDHDVRVVVRPALQGAELVRLALEAEQLEIAGANALDRGHAVGDGPRAAHDDPPGPHVHIFGGAATWELIANEIAETSFGPAPNPELKITPDTQMPDDDSLLLRRAFGDCKSIHLKPLAAYDQGWSGAKVYEVHAEGAFGRGETHTPYFVKFDERKRVFREFLNYEEQVDPYVPFHLGPHLVYSRCVLGAKRGLIVGDWVDESESLLESARAGRASPIISCLFEKTLRHWHRGAERRATPDLGSSLHGMKAPPLQRAERAKALGLRSSPAELIARAQSCSSSQINIGRIHGDMHSSNVRARKSDAILIDFGDAREGLLLLDPAALEASLVLLSLSDASAADAWVADLSPTFDVGSLFSTPPIGDPRSRWAWLHECVRQIRQHALPMECERGQYAVALANALMRKAGKDPGLGDPEATARAGAYVFAERALEAAASAGGVSFR
jgi:hypothetical protein